MITIKLETVDREYIDTFSGDTMGKARQKAVQYAKRLRPQISKNLVLRDCLGGMRGECVMIDGKAFVKGLG
jgi:hypothetical protein